MAGESLRPCERISGDNRFDQLRSRGARAGDNLLFIRALSNDLGHPRMGLAVGRKAGSAVVRSRLRRMFREAFRLNKTGLPDSIDLLLSPRRGAPEATLTQLGESLIRLAAVVAGKLEDRGER